MPGSHGVRRTRRGDFEIRLPPHERDALKTLSGEARAMLEDGSDPALSRLFPPAHPDDAELETEYRAMVGGDLVKDRLDALATVQRTASADRLTEDELLAWLTTLNDLRLILGTRLDVTEEEWDLAPDDPRAPVYDLYRYLSWLVSEIVEALSSSA